MTRTKRRATATRGHATIHHESHPTRRISDGWCAPDASCRRPPRKIAIARPGQHPRKAVTSAELRLERAFAVDPCLTCGRHPMTDPQRYFCRRLNHARLDELARRTGSRATAASHLRPKDWKVVDDREALCTDEPNALAATAVRLLVEEEEACRFGTHGSRQEQVLMGCYGPGSGDSAARRRGSPGVIALFWRYHA